MIEGKFETFDFAQVVNAMMRAKDKTKFWRNILDDWSKASWDVREANVKNVIKSAWALGNCETANIRAFRRGRNVIARVYVRFHPREIEEEFKIRME
jgi:hypothetical protein